MQDGAGGGGGGGVGVGGSITDLEDVFIDGHGEEWLEGRRQREN